MNSIEEVLVALRRVIRATDLHSKHLAKTTGLTAPQMLLLQILLLMSSCMNTYINAQVAPPPDQFSPDQYALGLISLRLGTDQFASN